MVKIETIIESELEALSALYEQLTGQLPPIERMREVYPKISEDSNYYLLGAKSDSDELLGSIMGIVCLELMRDCRPFMVMESLIVHTDWRRKGIGRLLLQSLEEIARERNCSVIQFCASSFRTDSHSFYTACGYAPGESEGFRKFLHKEHRISYIKKTKF